MASQYEILKEAREAMLNCKRNKSGSVNGNALNAIKDKYRKRLMAECGESDYDAIWQMHDLAKIVISA